MCEFWQDEQGLPHVHTGDELTSLTCLGYLHGRDRMWQMDYFRRTFQGRRAEVFGKDAIESDFLFKILGLEDKAKALFQGME